MSHDTLVTLLGFLAVMGVVLMWGNASARRNRPCNLCGARPHEKGCPVLHARGWAFGDRRKDRR